MLKNSQMKFVAVNMKVKTNLFSVNYLAYASYQAFEMFGVKCNA